MPPVKRSKGNGRYMLLKKTQERAGGNKEHTNTHTHTTNTKNTHTSLIIMGKRKVFCVGDMFKVVKYKASCSS